ncbi:GMC oxidoreductase [Rhizobium sp. X9]|uniref:GMC oxidoreductase n=1 Tax=Rhizobium sp. X9 TaxID=2815360 RepID=UPI001C0B3E3E|nr:GMC family oxidoreductase [Rhizobium sp. X9]
MTKCDVLVIGSGAAGSFAAKELTERGLDVMVLEFGRDIKESDFPPNTKGPKEKGMQLWARVQAAVTGQPIQSKVLMYGKHQRHLFVKDSENPYSTDPDKPFLWIRGKQLGGRLHTYGRMLLRWTDYDFKAASRDGHGEDWPISYDELAPYYDKVEEFLGIYGGQDGIKNLPSGKYKGPSKLTQAEMTFKEKTEAKWPDRHAISWRYMPPNAKRIPQPILAAKETGRLTIRTDAVVRRIVTDPSSGKATGVEFVDRLSGQVHTENAAVVIVCASAIESVRLLLNSASSKHPNGLGNSSGALGRYFSDQVPSIIMGTVPGRKGSEFDDTVPADPFYGVTGGVYIPRFENLDSVTDSSFLRGYAYQGTIGRLFTRPDRDAKYAFMGFGEMLPNKDNRITLNPRRKDKWGIPIPHISVAIGENEKRMLRAQTRSIKEMMDNAGLEIEFNGSSLGLEEGPKGAFPDADPISRFLFRQNFAGSVAIGATIHESGGARMGSDPAKSVLNAYNQCWDAPNVFVTDASSFASGGTAGTTLTLMALTVRTCEYIAEQHGRGQL